MTKTAGQEHFEAALYDEAENRFSTNFELVQKWHTLFGSRVLSEPGFPDDDLVILRWNLNSEEAFNEMFKALYTRDIVGVADAITDGLVVLYGMADVFGINADACFNEVMRSNYTKLGRDGKPVRREDGKYLKGPDYEKPDLANILENQSLFKAYRISQILGTATQI